MFVGFNDCSGSPLAGLIGNVVQQNHSLEFFSLLCMDCSMEEQ